MNSDSERVLFRALIDAAQKHTRVKNGATP